MVLGNWIEDIRSDVLVARSSFFFGSILKLTITASKRPSKPAALLFGRSLASSVYSLGVVRAVNVN